MNETIRSWKREPWVGKLQYCCLLVVVLAELIYLSPLGQQIGLTWVMVDYFLEIPAMVFLMLSIARGINRKGRTTMVLALLMLLWIGFVKVFRVIRGLNQIEPGEITCFYAFALPLAFAMEDGRRQWGLKALAALFLLEGVRLCVLGAGLYFGFLPDCYSGSVRWDGARLLQLFHPTNCATLLMLGMGISLGLCFRTKKRWLRGVLIALTAVQFGVQILTNGRTSTVFTCLMIGGILFCAIRRTGWKRAPVALAAGIAVMAVLFLASQKLFALHERNLTQMAIQASQTVSESQEQPERQLPQVNEDGELVIVNRQLSFGRALFSFNGRTGIWKEAVRGVLRNPKILVCGTDAVAQVLAEEGGASAMHTHNSFLEVLYALGLPGLLLALAISVLGLRAAVLLLWRNTDLWKSSVALVTVCLFGCGLLEPYLFVANNNQHYLSIFFLAAVGYLHQWCADSKE